MFRLLTEIVVFPRPWTAPSPAGVFNDAGVLCHRDTELIWSVASLPRARCADCRSAYRKDFHGSDAGLFRHPARSPRPSCDFIFTSTLRASLTRPGDQEEEGARRLARGHFQYVG